MNYVFMSVQLAMVFLARSQFLPQSLVFDSWDSPSLAAKQRKKSPPDTKMRGLGTSGVVHMIILAVDPGMASP